MQNVLRCQGDRRDSDGLEALGKSSDPSSVLVRAVGIEPTTQGLKGPAPEARTHQEPPVAMRSREGLSTACHATPPEGSFGLPDALRALAGAGLAEDALRAAVEALLRAAQPVPATAPRLVGGA